MLGEEVSFVMEDEKMSVASDVESDETASTSNPPVSNNGSSCIENGELAKPSTSSDDAKPTSPNPDVSASASACSENPSASANGWHSSTHELSDMDAVLQEESKRLDVIMSPSKTKTESYKIEDIDKDVQYKRLIELLSKSQFYTDFLVKKLQEEAASTSKNKKSSKSSKKQVMQIAADVISQKSQEDLAEEVTDPKEDLDHDQTKTLESGLTVPFDQPNLLSGATLRDYQVEGLNWLKLLYQNGVNGILADEMGLGKTIQVIALIAHLIEKNVRGPFLIIGPLSTLPNWAIEFERFTPTIPFYMYHGSEEKRISIRSKMFQKVDVDGRKVYPVIITSYDYPLRDAKFLRKNKWRYIIIDEGHRLKNHNSQLSRALRTYTSANRLLLTGTPLHNSLSELWALLNFLVPEIFDDLEIFESWFRLEDLAGEDGNEKLLEEEKKKQVLSTMHKILSPFMLRRVKSEVQLNLPPKKELIVYAPMTPIQLDLYKAVLDYNLNFLAAKEKDELVLESKDGKRTKRTCTSSKKFYNLNELFRMEDMMERGQSQIEDNKTLLLEDKENKAYAIRVKMQNPAMMLRKIVNHPYLVQYPLEPGTPYARIDEDLVRTSGKLQVLDAMLTKLKGRGHKVLLFSTFTIMIDILEDYLSLRSYNYVRLDGKSSLEDRQINIKEFNNNPDMFLFLISTRAGGLGINLAAADSVIIFDSDWNPQVDLQAQDRCHRIGQTRPVVVYRFVTAGTVDERIVVRAAAKRKLEKIIIHKGNYSALQKQDSSAIDLEELRKLLKSRDHQRVIHPNGFVFSDKELDDILDRSDLLEGKAADATNLDSSLEEQNFREYYGYVGTKKTASSEETKSNVKIIDQDSNDAPCEVAPVRRSPLKSASFSSVLSEKSVPDVSKQSENSTISVNGSEKMKDVNTQGIRSKKRKADDLESSSKNLKLSDTRSDSTVDASSLEDMDNSSQVTGSKTTLAPKHRPKRVK